MFLALGKQRLTTGWIWFDFPSILLESAQPAFISWRH
jgi:hypothetical protein